MSRPNIALCMIVKNEAAIVDRLVESVAPHIDYYVICDTGSTDGTFAKLQSAFVDRGIDGEMYLHEWQDFGHNRSEMLKLARGKADWLLLLDADWTLEIHGMALEQSLLHWSLQGEDCWLVAAAGGFQMTHKVLLQGDKPWKAVGQIHEVIDCDEPFTQRLLDGVTWTHHADSGTRDTRAETDLQILRAQVKANRDDPRARFYLAQTLKDMGRVEDAVTHYRIRAKLGGWEQETYLSLLYAGRLGVGLGWSDQARVGLFMEAWALLPDRLEALYELVSWLRGKGYYRAAWALLGPHKDDGSSGRSWLTPPDAVFAEGWIADYGLQFEESIVAYWIGDYRRCVDLSDTLVDSDLTPHDTKVQAAKNAVEGHLALGIRRSALS